MSCHITGSQFSHLESRDTGIYLLTKLGFETYQGTAACKSDKVLFCN